jgi:RES domain
VSSDLADPPRDLPQPNLAVWPAARPMYRVHHVQYGATEFNPGFGGGRFHPIRSAASASIPTIYGSSSIDGALSETVFHDVPVSGAAKQISQSALIPLLLCTLAPKRALHLIEIKGFGLQKLGLTRSQLIDTNADRYTAARRWAEALFEREPAADGLIWMSRQHDASEAVVLFGGRVVRSDLEVIEAPRGLYPPSLGWLEVERAAEAAGIMVTTP